MIPLTAACRASRSYTVSWGLPKLLSTELIMHPTISSPLPPPPPALNLLSIRIFSNVYSGLISFRIDWFDLLAFQGTFKGLLQLHNSKASILQLSLFYGPTLIYIHDYWENHSFDYYMDLCQQSDVSAF